MDAFARQIGETLRRLRKEQLLTLDQMASLTQVSKPMLGQIERGQSVPTISTLWKIATGLKVPLSALLEQNEAAYTIGRAEEKNVIMAEEGCMKAWTLFAFDPLRGQETFRIDLEPGCRHASPPHQRGVEEMVLVSSGTLVMELSGSRIELQENEALRFQADLPHAYLNEGEKPCRFFNTIFYPSRKGDHSHV